MLKEVCFALEARKGNSIGVLLIGALPTPIHTWFTTEILDIGNGDHERILSCEHIGLLTNVIVCWLEVNCVKEILEPNEVEPLQQTLAILDGFDELFNHSIITFSNYSRGGQA